MWYRKSSSRRIAVDIVGEVRQMIHPGGSTATWVRQACRLEVLAEKPGNVSPSYSFSDANVADFLDSANSIAPILETAKSRQIGAVILDAVVATHDAVGHNTNLGIILLLTPLCAVQDWDDAASEMKSLLAATTVQDATDMYRAIRIASPGGLGTTRKEDVSMAPTSTLLECMRLAADRDFIAREYSTAFAFILSQGLQLLAATAAWHKHHDKRLGWLAVQLLAIQSDSLIARKNGPSVAAKVQALAARTIAEGWPNSSQHDAYETLSSYLCDPQHKRNPGATADLIAAILFCALRSGIITCDDAESSFLFNEQMS